MDGSEQQFPLLLFKVYLYIIYLALNFAFNGIQSSLHSECVDISCILLVRNETDLKGCALAQESTIHGH